jgi:Subtilase family
MAVAARLWQVAAFTLASVCAAAVPGPTGSRVDAAGRLQIDVHFDCTLAPPVAALSAAGLSVSSSLRAGAFCVVEGWALPAALPQIDTVPGVIRVTAPSYVRPSPLRAVAPMVQGTAHASVQRQAASTTAIDQNGVSIMRADQFVTQTGTDGSGVTVGVQSSGVYSLSAIQARGELPAVQVVYPAGSNTQVEADEGTALLEEIHAVAPGAKLVFCGPQTFVDYMSCLTQLVNAGATILLDDIGNINDGLLNQDNDETTAISSFLTQNPTVMMLSSAGNNDGTYWEGAYAPVTAPTTLPTLSCPSGSGLPDNYVASFGGATSETLTILGDTTFPLLLAWADPPTQITSDFDVFWFAPGSTTPEGCFSSSGSTTDQAMQYVTLADEPSMPSGTPYTLVVASPDASAAGKFLKLWAGGDGLTAFSVATSGGLVSPQAMVPGLLVVGAVDGSNGIGNTIEPYSSSGPLTVAFPAPASLQAPTVVAPDGINVDAAGTYFESYLFPDGNFYGTSAAVPNAAAVAALLRSDFPTLTVGQLSTALESGATVLGTTPAPNDVYGYGRVDALGALGTLPVPTITALTGEISVGSATTAAQPLTVSGTGPLTFTVTSSNTALVPSSVVAAGSPGVTFSSGCGTVTLNCTVSVTPIRGQAGTATLTISVLDGANRAASTMMTLSSTDPAPAAAPPTASSPAASSGHSGGGALQSWALLWLGALVAWSQRRRRGAFAPA